MKILQYGHKGWIGNLIKEELNKRNIESVNGNIRCYNVKDLDNEIKKVTPTHIICSIGRTHSKYIPTIDYLEDISKSKYPVMMIGGGVRISNAVDEFRALGSLLKIPCFPTWNALDAVASDYEYYGGRVGTYGGAGRNFGIQNSDLLLALKELRQSYKKNIRRH